MFETKRSLISIFQKSDFEDVKKLYVNPDVRRFLGGVREENLINAGLEEALHPDGDSYYWVVREKHSNDFIGSVSLDPHHDGEHIEVSYQFLPEWWGKGYATEAVRVIIDYALNELHLPKIVAETQTANTASRRLLERLNMQLERTVSRFGAEQAIYSISKKVD